MKVAFPLFLLCVFVIMSPLDAAGELSEKTSEELVLVARQSEPARQFIIFEMLAVRYRQPGEIIINSRVPPQELEPTNTPVNNVVITNVLEVAKSDHDVKIRLAALHVMETLLNRTNILELFDGFLGDPELAVRLRACGAIVNYSQQQKISISARLMDSLASCLNPDNDSGSLVVALKYIRELGFRGSRCGPDVSRLKKHPTKEVREAVKVTLKAIETKFP